MFSDSLSSTELYGALGGCLILVESSSEWVLAPKFDDDLQVGSVFEILGTEWRVIWESHEGFGVSRAN